VFCLILPCVLLLFYSSLVLLPYFTNLSLYGLSQGSCLLPIVDLFRVGLLQLTFLTSLSRVAMSIRLTPLQRMDKKLSTTKAVPSLSTLSCPYTCISCRFPGMCKTQNVLFTTPSRTFLCARCTHLILYNFATIMYVSR
jgi:hypothetical protein